MDVERQRAEDQNSNFEAELEDARLRGDVEKQIAEQEELHQETEQRTTEPQVEQEWQIAAQAKHVFEEARNVDGKKR